jgi:hypothetical protein
MSRLVFLIQPTCLSGISRQMSGVYSCGTTCTSIHLKSPSDELANTQVSPGLFPKRDPSGSVSITCFIACPTRPVPPVTKITALDMVVVKMDDKRVPGQAD